MTKNTAGIDKERVRLLADRLCYLNHGVDGLRWRHGMQRADRAYRDEFDAYAAEHAAELLPPRREIPVLAVREAPKTIVTRDGWVQPSLF